MARKFKSGDWVKIKGKLSAPKMQVLKYVTKKDPLLGIVDDDSYLECIWYSGGERKAQMFHQNKLIKTMDTGGLFRTNFITTKLSVTKI